MEQKIESLLKAKLSLMLTITLCLLSVLSNGQDPFHIIYGTNEGLPSQEVYDIHVDKNNKIWLTTDRGVSIYDGYEFTTYTTQHGLTYNTNFMIVPDKWDRLWFVAYDGTLSYYENNRFHGIPLNDSLANFSEGSWMNTLFFDESKNLYFTYYERIPVNPKKRGYYYQIDTAFQTIKTLLIDSTKVRGEMDFFMQSIGDESLISWKENKKVVSCNIKTGEGYDLVVVKERTDKMKGLDKIFRIKEKRVQKVYETENDIDGLFEDYWGEIWVCTSRGLKVFKDANFDEAPRSYFKDYNITGITQDKENNYWISTLHSGIIFVPSFSFIGFKKDGQGEENITSIEQLGDFLIYGTSNGLLAAIDNNFNIRVLNEAIGHDISHIYSSKNSAYTSYFCQIIIENDKPKFVIPSFKDLGPRLIKELKNEDLFCARSNYVIFRDGKEIYRSFEGEKPFNRGITCVEEDTQGNVLAGTLSGLIKVNGQAYDEIEDLSLSNPLLKTRISTIKRNGRSDFWIATIGNGLLYMTPDTIFQITQADGISGNLINTIYLQNDSILWIGSNQGLDKLTFQKESERLLIKQIETFNTVNGLPDNMVKDIAYWKKRIWVLTNNGLYHNGLNAKTAKSIEPKLFLNSIQVNNKDIDVHSDLELKYNQNDILFEYTGISYRKPKNHPFYRYRFTKNSEAEQWRYTNARSVYFSNWRPGAYSFRVEAQNKDQLWTKAGIERVVVIRPHFTQTWWFKSISILSVLAVIYLIQKRRNKNRKWKEAQERLIQEANFRIKNAELAVLRKQMNPHFIFNSLNAIQNFIFDKDVSKANHFLSTFSKLMRNSLQMSKLENVTLFKEIAFLKAYLELEKMRFPDHFEYQFIIDEEISLNHCLIPPLFLQPLLENAIKHGFKEIEYFGKLEVNIKKKGEDLLLITIEDNGKGFRVDNTSEVEDGKYASMSLDIVRERIKIINYQIGEERAEFSITARENNIGTIAVLILPIKYIFYDQVRNY